MAPRPTPAHTPNRSKREGGPAFQDSLSESWAAFHNKQHTHTQVEHVCRSWDESGLPDQLLGNFLATRRQLLPACCAMRQTLKRDVHDRTRRCASPIGRAGCCFGSACGADDWQPTGRVHDPPDVVASALKRRGPRATTPGQSTYKARGQSSLIRHQSAVGCRQACSVASTFG